jgi:hypothetical protein
MLRQMARNAEGLVIAMNGIQNFSSTLIMNMVGFDWYLMRWVVIPHR